MLADPNSAPINCFSCNVNKIAGIAIGLVGAYELEPANA